MKTLLLGRIKILGLIILLLGCLFGSVFMLGQSLGELFTVLTQR